MATEVIVDSSVIAALVTPERYSDWASNRLAESDYFHVLDLNYYEVANAIKQKKSDKFSPKDAARAFSHAIELMNLFAIHQFSEIIDDAMTLALEMDISVYDAAFVALAEKMEIRLITLDEKLAKKLEGTKYHDILESPNKKTA